jgi:hypothetical protein
MADTQQSIEESQIENEVPAGVQDLLALYEHVEDIYIQATNASSTVGDHIFTGDSTNFPLQRGA